jgi:hypothetical protein
MLGSDGFAYVVKFQNNPQHLRVLANEFIATGIAREFGLRVPQVEIVEVPQWLVASTSELRIESEKGLDLCQAGLQFGSRYVGGLLPGQTVDYLPELHLSEVTNLRDFSGMLVIDKWTCNSDGRQAVFHKSLREKHYTATFIDQGYCFGAGSWRFSDAPLRGVYSRNVVYRDVKGWDSFQPWLELVDRLDGGRIWDIADKIPQEWYGGPAVELQNLIETLFTRRHRIRELIDEFRLSSREPFPQWKWSPTRRVAISLGQVLSFPNKVTSDV